MEKPTTGASNRKRTPTKKAAENNESRSDSYCLFKHFLTSFLTHLSIPDPIPGTSISINDLISGLQGESVIVHLLTWELNLTVEL